MSKVIYIEKEECTSCALCTDSAPEYFRMDEDDIAETHNDGNNINEANVPEGDVEKVQGLIDECPAECIHWK